MAMQTTTRTGAPIVKPFAWSYSRLKNFEQCPKRSYHVDILPKGDPQKVVEPQGESLKWGNFVHDAMAARCGPGLVPLPKEVSMYEPWAQKVLIGGGDIGVEESYTLTQDFKPAAGNFTPDVWFRAKVDFRKIQGDIALVVDWKTGKILEDSVQLALTSACLFAKYPALMAIRASFVWLAEDAESSETFLRSDLPTIWRNVWPRIESIKQAFQATNYPPKPSGICRGYCAVTQCPYHGKGSR